MQRIFLIVCLAFGLAACDEVESTLENFSLFDRNAPKSSEATSEIELTSSRVAFRGALGFCVDPRSVRARDRRGSAVFGNCAAVSGLDDVQQPYEEALVTVAATRVAAPEAEAFRNTQALENHLVSKAGRATLSRSGKAESVEILDSFVTRKAVYVRLRDTARGEKKALAPEHWKAVFGMPEAVVSISVRGLEGGALTPSDGLALVREFTGNTVSKLEPES